MKKEVNHLTDAEKLRHWLDYCVPRGEYNKQKARLVEACLVPVSTFNNWIYGKCRIPNSAKRDINRITLEVSGMEIFTIVKLEEYTGGVSGVSSGKTI